MKLTITTEHPTEPEESIGEALKHCTEGILDVKAQSEFPVAAQGRRSIYDFKPLPPRTLRICRDCIGEGQSKDRNSGAETMRPRIEWRVTHPEPGPFHVEARRGKRQPWEPVAISESYDLALRIIMIEQWGRGIYPLSERLGIPIPPRD